MKLDYEDRKYVYDRIFELIIYADIYLLPTPLDHICEKLNIDLIPLSQILESGLTREQIFFAWGNENGHLMPWYKNNKLHKIKIAYNDDKTHLKRKNFTIAEELSHYALKHFKHPMYRIDRSVPWDENLYQYHEECARMGAGLILCPPPAFYKIQNFFTPSNIHKFCNVSRSCANTSFEVLKTCRQEIENHPKYKILENQYGYVIYVFNSVYGSRKDADYYIDKYYSYDNDFNNLNGLCDKYYEPI